MKQVIIITVFSLFSQIVVAQMDEEDIPKGPIVVAKVVLDAFQKEYPGIKNTNWNYGDGDYEVVFTKEGFDMTVDYNVYGQCEETETEIRLSDLPQNVLDYLVKNYNSFVIVSASKIVTENYDVAYVAEIGKKGKFWDITFTSDGGFLKEEAAD